MFPKETYIRRRKDLIVSMRAMGECGLLILLGNIETPVQGSPDTNGIDFNQDSNFLYFFGLNRSRLAAIIDSDTGEASLFGDDASLNDLIWSGLQPSVRELAAQVGVVRTGRYHEFDEAVKTALSAGRPVHVLPPHRYFNLLRICEVLGCTPENAKRVAAGGGRHASESFVKAVIGMRLIKDDLEIGAMDETCDLGVEMHEAGRRVIRPGANENDVSAAMDGVSKRTGWGRSFATICTQHGERLHAMRHDQPLVPGNLLVVDAGVESNEHYASDFTRTYPVSGRFTQKQRDIYQIVLDCNELAFSLVKPGITYRDVHLAAARKMLEGLSALDLVHGDLDEMVAQGIAGLFQPHGLGHNLGLDSHDMADLGEDWVGYDPDQRRSEQLGLGNLRMARRLRPGHVITDEPGIYFIPGLIEQWRSEGLGKDFVNFSKLESYYDFGGIRLEDDVLVTEGGARRLGSRRLPIGIGDIEEAMKYHL